EGAARAPHARPDRPPGVRGRRPRGGARGRQPVRRLPQPLRRRGPRLAVPVPARQPVRRQRAARGVLPDRHARDLDAVDPDRPGRRVRVPLRPVQHRRQRPAHHRFRGRLRRSTRGGRRDGRARRRAGGRAGRHAVGRAAGRPEGIPRGPRSHLHDHAELHRRRYRRLPRRLGRPARDRRPTRLGGAAGEHDVPRPLGGRPGCAHRPRRRPRRRRRVLGHPEPHDARLRGARRRLQPRGGSLRGRLGAALDRAGDGHLGAVRRARGRGGGARRPRAA
ncbi:MAG: ABC transporter, permease protein 1 (cluster 11, riboflavin/purine nucleoside/unknown), partial [uncultured Thermoleophilia bacterium]